MVLAKRLAHTIVLTIASINLSLQGNVHQTLAASIQSFRRRALVVPLGVAHAEIENRFSSAMVVNVRCSVRYYYGVTGSALFGFSQKLQSAFKRRGPTKANALLKLTQARHGGECAVPAYVIKDRYRCRGRRRHC